MGGVSVSTEHQMGFYRKGRGTRDWRQPWIRSCRHGCLLSREEKKDGQKERDTPVPRALCWLRLSVTVSGVRVAGTGERGAECRSAVLMRTMLENLRKTAVVTEECAQRGLRGIMEGYREWHLQVLGVNPSWAHRVWPWVTTGGLERVRLACVGVTPQGEAEKDGGTLDQWGVIGLIWD